MPHDANDFRERLRPILRESIELCYHPFIASGYSGRTDIHKKLKITRNQLDIEIDLRIAKIVYLVWERQWHTVGSCESAEDDGLTYLQFLAAEFGADDFCSVLKEHGIPYKTVLDDKPMAISLGQNNNAGKLEFNSLKVKFNPADIPRVQAALESLP